MKKTVLLPLLASAATALLGHSAHAAVTVDSASSFINLNAGNATPYTVTAATIGAFDATGSDKLIVALSSRQGLATNTTMTYGGVSMTVAAINGNPVNNDGLGAVFYLDNPLTNGDLVLSGTGHNSFSIQFFAVSGLAAGGPIQSVSDAAPNGDPAGTTVSLTTGSAGGFVVGAIGANSNAGTSSATSGSYSFDSSRGNIASWVDNSGSSTYTQSYVIQESAGVMVEFAAVPEPSSMALLGLAGGLLTLRRRRH